MNSWIEKQQRISLMLRVTEIASQFRQHFLTFATFALSHVCGHYYLNFI